MHPINSIALVARVVSRAYPAAKWDDHGSANHFILGKIALNYQLCQSPWLFGWEPEYLENRRVFSCNYHPINHGSLWSFLLVTSTSSFLLVHPSPFVINITVLGDLSQWTTQFLASIYHRQVVSEKAGCTIIVLTGGTSWTQPFATLAQRCLLPVSALLLTCALPAMTPMVFGGARRYFAICCSIVWCVWLQPTTH